MTEKRQLDLLGGEPEAAPERTDEKVAAASTAPVGAPVEDVPPDDELASESDDDERDDERDDDDDEREDEREDEESEDDESEDDADEDARHSDVEPIARSVRPRAHLSPRLDARAGAVLGGAIGDAMGHPTEFLSMTEIKRRWPPQGVTGFELWRGRGADRHAPYTDDTQMAEAVLRTLLEGRDAREDLDHTMQRMARHFISWANHPQGGHRAPGNACLSGCRALERGIPWHTAGGSEAGGCGSVMRAYPFGLLFDQDLAKCEEWAVAHSKLTHRDPIALAASAAMGVGVALVLRGATNDVVLSEMIAAACRYSPRTGVMMAEALTDAKGGVPPEETLDRLRGWAAHEAIAAAVYIVARHPDDAESAILEGANTPGDSDSLATLAGALVGARVGLSGLPADWVRDVERSVELMELAGQI